MIEQIVFQAIFSDLKTTKKEGGGVKISLDVSDDQYVKVIKLPLLKDALLNVSIKAEE